MVGGLTPPGFHTDDPDWDIGTRTATQIEGRLESPGGDSRGTEIIHWKKGQPLSGGTVMGYCVPTTSFTLTSHYIRSFQCGQLVFVNFYPPL